MDFSVAHLFDYFLTPERDPIDRTTLQAVLGIIPETTQDEQLTIALDGLVRLGFLELSDTGYRCRPDETLVQGRLRCYNKGYCFAIRDEPDVDDIYIYASNLNGAWNGDRVLARVTKDGYRKRSPEGEVAAVIERVNLTLVARIKITETGIKAIPLDDRLLFNVELLLEPEQEPLSDGQVVYVEVKRYPLANLPTQGTILKVLGSDPAFSMDVDLICSKYSLPQTFPEAAIVAVGSLPANLSKAELKKRQDYRSWLTVTIEAGDLQQVAPNVAISLKALGNDLWQVAVHIADVAAWVEAGSVLDQEAQQRGSVVYLDQATLPLFPSELVARAALHPQLDRLTISVLISVTAVGVVTDFTVQPSIIHPSVHLTYEQVQALLASTPPEPLQQEEPTPDLLSLLHQLHQLSQKVRQQRHDTSGFTIPVNATQGADDLSRGALLTSPFLAQQMMQEWLVLVNRLMGEHVQALKLPAVAYRQTSPAPEALQSFMRLATNLNLEVSLDSPEQVTTLDMQRFCQQLGSPAVEESGARATLSDQLLATLPSLNYYPLPSEESEGTFGLGIPTPYVPITAPLQRYADLVNQHLLHALFSKGRERSSPRSKTTADILSRSAQGQVTWSVLPPKLHEELVAGLHPWIPTLNTTIQQIRQAEQELMGLKKSDFMQQHLGETLTGLIVRVQNYGFFVQLEPMLAEGLVHVRSLKDDWYEFHPKYQALIGRKNRKQFRLGERVEVQIKSVDYYRQQTDLTVIGEGRVYETEEL